MTTQDRRITKTRKAIYQAFLHLLNQKDYESITVQEIIDLADVGRSTFYSHYESKELLLDEHDVYPMVADELIKAHPTIPHSYLKHLVVTNFIETLSWWLKKGASYSEQEVVQFYSEILHANSK